MCVFDVSFVLFSCTTTTTLSNRQKPTHKLYIHLSYKNKSFAFATTFSPLPNEPECIHKSVLLESTRIVTAFMIMFFVLKAEHLDRLLAGRALRL